MQPVVAAPQPPSPAPLMHCCSPSPALAGGRSLSGFSARSKANHSACTLYFINEGEKTSISVKRVVFQSIAISCNSRAWRSKSPAWPPLCNVREKREAFWNTNTTRQGEGGRCCAHSSNLPPGLGTCDSHHFLGFSLAATAPILHQWDADPTWAQEPLHVSPCFCQARIEVLARTPAKWSHKGIVRLTKLQ